MARILVTALAALTMLYVGIQSLAFRSQSVADTNPTGASSEAFNLTRAVATDGTAILGTALPSLFIVSLLSLLVGYLVLTR